MPDSKRVTLATIAAETGVSVTTISKVLNGRGDVAAADALGMRAIRVRTGEYSRLPDAPAPWKSSPDLAAAVTLVLRCLTTLGQEPRGR